MNPLIQQIREFLSASEEETKDKAPEGVCPVCWGYQAYDNKIRKLYKDKQIDVNNHTSQYMLIQDFLIQNIEGIRLKNGDVTSCPTCNTTNREYVAKHKPQHSKTEKPIRRHKTLQPLSREHHHGLLLCWKIRMGFTRKVETNRIKQYADWFFDTHLLPHFEAEEEYVFPVLGNEHELVKKAISDHRRLKRLFENEGEVEKSLSLIEEELERHIRFEERMLFNEIQKFASEDQLTLIDQHHHEAPFEERTVDEFWR